MESTAKSTLGSLLDDLRAAYAAKESAEIVLQAYLQRGETEKPAVQRLSRIMRDASGRIEQAQARMAPFRLAFDAERDNARQASAR
jgi:tRNA C32,U32 (ribose-2'-O)-methylase TrmJ